MPITRLVAHGRFEAPRIAALLALLRRAPAKVRALADRCFELLKADPQHPSLHFKRVGRFRSVRIGLHYRALGVDVTDGVLWVWIGARAEYDNVVA